MAFHPGCYPLNPLMGANPVLPDLYWQTKSPQQMICELYRTLNSLVEYTNQLSNYYVPQFKGEWSATESYDPNDLVVDAEGNTWVALKPVPEGTPLEDSEYWNIAYPYSEQFEQLSKTVQTFDTRITTNTQNISTNTQNINTNTQNIANNTQDINELKQSYTKHMVVIGDSFTAPSYTDVTGVWIDAVAPGLGVTPHNYAIAQMGFSIGTQNYSYQLDLANNDNSFNNINVEYVIFCGMLNDAANNENTIYNAMVQTINKAINIFPNAKIIVAGPNTWNTFDMANDSGNVTSTFIQANVAATACRDTGAFFINTMLMGVGSNKYTNRGHPDADLQLLLGTLIKNAIINGSERPMITGASSWNLFKNAAFTSSNEHVTGNIETFSPISNNEAIINMTITTDTEYVDSGNVTLTFPFNLQFYVSENFIFTTANNITVGRNPLTTNPYTNVYQMQFIGSTLNANTSYRCITILRF